MQVRTILPGQAWKVTKWVGDDPSGSDQTKVCNVLVHRSRTDPEVVTLFVFYNKERAYFLAAVHGNDVTPFKCPKYTTKTEAMRAAEEWAESFARGTT